MDLALVFLIFDTQIDFYVIHDFANELEVTSFPEWNEITYARVFTRLSIHLSLWTQIKAKVSYST